TTGATITQCNGSANGGTLVGLTCTATGTRPSSHGVRINQCNGSANGGGALVICSANIANRRIASSSSGTGGTTGGTTAPSLPNTSILTTTDVPESGPNSVVFAGIFLLAFGLVATRLSMRSTRSH
ncbi:MAG TPA: hypothetical protein VGJ46_11290, partial [Candidatus Limnocylindrales bacterium]